MGLGTQVPNPNKRGRLIHIHWNTYILSWASSVLQYAFIHIKTGLCIRVAYLLFKCGQHSLAKLLTRDFLNSYKLLRNFPRFGNCSYIERSLVIKRSAVYGKGKQTRSTWEVKRVNRRMIVNLKKNVLSTYFDISWCQQNIAYFRPTT